MYPGTYLRNPKIPIPLPTAIIFVTPCYSMLLHILKWNAQETLKSHNRCIRIEYVCHTPMILWTSIMFGCMHRNCFFTSWCGTSREFIKRGSCLPWIRYNTHSNLLQCKSGFYECRLYSGRSETVHSKTPQLPCCHGCTMMLCTKQCNEAALIWPLSLHNI